MIDIAFADSEAGTLLLSGLVEHRNLVAPWIHMEMGNLHPGCQSDERLREIHSWFKDPFLSDALFTEEVLREQMNKLFLVLTRAQEGETIRIWYDHTPEMFCGFAYVVYLVSRMENCKAKILSVCFNEHVELSARFDRLAQISPSDCEELVSVERCLTIEERTEIAQKWSELCKQDYPLRTVIGGEIVGVPINYYDGMIKESIPSNKRFTVFDIIKKVLPRKDSPDYFILMWRTACVLKELDVEAGFRTTYLPEPPDAISGFWFRRRTADSASIYLVAYIETDFDEPAEDGGFPVVNYPEGIGCGYANGEFLLSGRDAADLYNNFCKLYDLEAHVQYYSENDFNPDDEELCAELKAIEAIIEKAQAGTLNKFDFFGLRFALWMGEIEVLWIANDRSIAVPYKEINDLTVIE